MRNSPMYEVDPISLDHHDRDQLARASDTIDQTGTINVSELPEAVREQMQLLFGALSRGTAVAVLAQDKPLTSTEAAQALGMSRAHLTRLCNEGRIQSFTVGNALRISTQEVLRILRARGTATVAAREAASTVDQRRLARPASAAGFADN